MQEMQVQPLIWEDPVEEEVATHSSILAWETPWTEESGGLQSMESKELGTTDQLSTVQHSCSLTLNSEKEWLNSCVCVLFIDFF